MEPLPNSSNQTPSPSAPPAQPNSDNSKPNNKPQQGNTPPLPNFAVRIGVTGHRMDVIPPKGEDEALRKAITQVLQNIQQITAEIFADRSSTGIQTYSNEYPSIRIISPLAEGADRIVAEEALKLKARAEQLKLKMELQCPLPFPRDEYTNDFSEESKEDFYRLLSEANAVFELDGPTQAEQRHEAYQMVGRTVLRQCDLLIAIWDQKRPSGLGGTGEITQEAANLGIPIIWIHPRLEYPPSLWEPSQRIGDPGTRKDLSLLRKRMKTLFEFPRHAIEVASANQFFKEKQAEINFGFFYRAFCKLWVWHWPRPKLFIKNFLSTAYEDWDTTWQILSLTEQREHTRGEFTKPLETGYLEPFAWADGLADLYANRYRSSFVATYLAGALAIFFAYLGSRPCSPHLYSWIELGLIIAIIVLTWWGRKKRWHHRWMDYRALAEDLRQLQFLTLLGRTPSSVKIPTHLGPSDPSNKWFNWYFRALSRKMGLIQAQINSSYLDSYRQVLEDWIQSQRDYHHRSCEHHEKLHHHLLSTAHFLFFITLGFCLLHIFEHRLVELWTLGTIVFPAFGGALGAILHVGESERTALRSRPLRDHLEMLACKLRCAGESATSQDLGRIAQNLSDVALAELVDWRFVFLEKDLELPA